MSITDPQQAKMFIFMPILVAYFAIQFPIGLSIYWIVSTALYVLEYVVVVGRPKKIGVAPPKEQRVAAKSKAKAAGARGQK
jgi:membrane protein insertase Oxa1/YidC/SpoIIIJ